MCLILVSFVIFIPLSDPDKDVDGWGSNEREVSFTFGKDIVGKFLKKQYVDLICCAYQVVEDEYEFLFLTN